MKKFLLLGILILGLACLALSGVNMPALTSWGQAPDTINTLQLGTTFRGVQLAMAESLGTLRMVKSLADVQYILFGWPMTTQYGFTIVKLSQGGIYGTTELMAELQQGLAFPPGSTGEIVKCLEAHGWKLVPAAELPLILKALVYGGSFLASVGKNLTTFYIVPVAPLLEEMKSWPTPVVQ